ncbi:MAG: lipoprotein transporter ATP-binding protein [Bacteroidetes bacterium]|nr:lipoprotein transporter ATP-binding protein [Bacteroidota bacterium]
MNFGELQVLKGIDVSIGRGEIVTLVGPSGAGKTTFLHIMGTLLKPASGEVVINGKKVYGMSEKQLSRFRNQHIGFVFQFHHLLPEFTAIENVCIPAFIKKVPRHDAEKKAKELLDFLGLGQRLEHKPGELSGGEQQRVAVARALINNPDIILADEPSGNLDSQNRKELHELFFSLRERYKQTIVIVTHDKDLASMSDRTLTMRDGQIVK